MIFGLDCSWNFFCLFVAIEVRGGEEESHGRVYSGVWVKFLIFIIIIIFSKLAFYVIILYYFNKTISLVNIFHLSVMTILT